MTKKLNYKQFLYSISIFLLKKMCQRKKKIRGTLLYNKEVKKPIMVIIHDDYKTDKINNIEIEGVVK